MQYTFRYSGLYVTIKDELDRGIVFPANIVTADFAKTLVEQTNGLAAGADGKAEKRIDDEKNTR